MSGLPGGMGEMTVEQTIGQVFRGVVQDIAPDGSTTLEQVIESVAMTTTSPMGSITFDSANPPPNRNSLDRRMADLMSAMIGEPFSVVMSAAGAVQKVEGFSRMFDKMLKTVPQDPAGAATMDALKQSFSDEFLLNMMAQGFAQLPSRPVKVGESWNSEITMRNP